MTSSTPTTSSGLAKSQGMSPRRKAKLFRTAQYVLLAVLVVVGAVLADWGTLKKSFFSPEVLSALPYDILFRALLNTILYTACGFALALIAGVVLALMRLSSVGPYRWIATAYIEFFRGVPALLVFITFGFGIPIAFGVLIPFLWTIAIALGLVGSAYIAETVRAGIQAVPKGQTEAARSLGMGPARTMIFIIIPQAFRIILPPLTNELILLTKDSSLAFVLGMAQDQYELTFFGRSFMNQYANMTPLVLVGLCYLIITLPLGALVRMLERRNEKAN